MPKGPKHFKVHCSVRNHAKTAKMFTENDLLATWVRLGILAVERFADRTGNSFRVSDHELVAITGKGRLDVARTLLSRLADVSQTSASRDGDVWLISLPNFGKKQGFGLGNGAKTGASASASPTATSTKEKNPEREPASRAARAPRKSPEVSFPGSMVQRDWDELGARHGVDPIRLEEVAAGWADEKDRRYTATGWRRAIDRALRDRWSWTASLFGRPAAPGAPIERESPAQARERRTLEAARRVIERGNVDPFRLALIAGGGEGAA